MTHSLGGSAQQRPGTAAHVWNFRIPWDAPVERLGTQLGLGLWICCFLSQLLLCILVGAYLSGLSTDRLGPQSCLNLQDQAARSFCVVPQHALLFPSGLSLHCDFFFTLLGLRFS